MVRTDFRRKRGDTGRPLVVPLRDGDDPIDLAGAAEVSAQLRHGELLRGGTCEITDAARGEVVYEWAPGDLDTAGTWLLEFVVAWADGTRTTVPAGGYFGLAVLADLEDPWEALPTWAPSLAEIARMMPAYTVGRYDDDDAADEVEEEVGAERGTFTAATSPTAEHVRGLVVDACDEVSGRVGVPISVRHERLARRCAALRAAALISTTKLPGDTDDARGEHHAHMSAFDEALAELVVLCRRPLALRLV